MFSKLLLHLSNRKFLSVFVPASCSWLFTIWGVYYFADYGIALFIFIPFFIGVSATVLHGYKSEWSIGSALGATTLSLLTYCIGLILFALEGAICIVMAAPLGWLIASVGTVVGRAYLNHSKGTPLPVVVGLGLLVPIVMSFENLSDNKPTLYSVTTSVIIEAPKQKVWEKVVAFSRIEEPEELLFKAGVAYPTHADIEGKGVGAIRYCNFSTGRFVEPITAWNEPDLLQFSVKEMPEPLKEISPYDIKPTHLHGYFVSTKGQFKLTQMADGKTLLEGTTWYYHKIAPAAYWKLWTDHIIHKIHNRVLQHIRKDAEL